MVHPCDFFKKNKLNGPLYKASKSLFSTSFLATLFVSCSYLNNSTHSFCWYRPLLTLSGLPKAKQKPHTNKQFFFIFWALYNENVNGAFMRFFLKKKWSGLLYKASKSLFSTSFLATLFVSCSYSFSLPHLSLGLAQNQAFPSLGRLSLATCNATISLLLPPTTPSWSCISNS